MLGKFKDSVFGGRINPNSASIALLATNLFNKLKVKGVLSDYVERERKIDYFNIKYTGSLIEDTDFTFENCITGNAELSEDLNIGRVHTISYERKFATTTTLEYEVSPVNKVTFPSLDVGFYKLKYIRNHLVVSLYADDELVGSGNLLADEDKVLSTSLLNTTDKFANYKITSGSKILHWWKFNFTIPSGIYDELNSIFANDELMYNDYVLLLDKFLLPSEEAIFLDEGYNDEDFYSLWYPITFMFASVISYSQSILDIKGNLDIVKLFLNSKGIGLNNSLSDEDIITIYGDWVSEFSKRGTIQVANKRNLVGGVGKNILAQHSLERWSNIIITPNLEINFDAILTSGVSFKVLDVLEVQVSGVNIDIDYFYYNLSAVLVSEPISFEYAINGVVNIDFKVSEGGHIVVLFDGNLMAEADISYGAGLEVQTKDVFTNVVAGGESVVVANLTYTSFGVKYIYPLSEENVICSEIGKFYENDLFLIDNTATPILADPSAVVIYNDDKNNIEKNLVDGELLRLIDYSENDENLYALVRNLELGQCNGVSYQNSRQSYPIINLNKFYNKNKKFKTLSTLPLTENSLGKVRVNSLGNLEFDVIVGEYLGINAYSRFSFFNRFMINIDPNIDYEFSIRVKSTGLGNAIRFGGVFYDSSGAVLTNIKSATTGVSFGVAEAYIFDETDFDLIEEREVWIRGIIKKNGTINDPSFTTNIGLGQGLIMGSDVVGFRPIIEFGGTSVETIIAYDIQVRPLTLPILKGYLGTKNIMVNYIKNNSGRTTEFIEKEITDKYVPYNVSVKNKIL